MFVKQGASSSQTMDTDLFEFIRSLGFGALLGSGTLGLLYALFAARFSDAVSFRDVLLLGAFIGAGLHRAVDTYVISGILYPISSFVSYYSRLVQVLALRELHFISYRHANNLLRKLTDAYFLDDSNLKAKLLFPKRTQSLPPPADKK